MQVDCRVCHGEDFRGKTREAFGWVDEAGRPLPRSADLVHGVFKSGSTPRDLYRSIFLGRGGSPMPAYGPLFHSEEKRWAIVWFVKSLAKEP
jgi:mono/diheme cytochrome c family protein